MLKNNSNNINNNNNVGNSIVMEEMNGINSDDDILLKSSGKINIETFDNEELNESGVEDNSKKKTPFLVLAYLYFVVVATVLGAGILSLPVKLSQSGFSPFVASYSLCFIMQLLSLLFFIEILQRAYSIMKANSYLSTQLENIVVNNNNIHIIGKDDQDAGLLYENNDIINSSTESGVIEHIGGDNDELFQDKTTSNGSSIRSSPPLIDDKASTSSFDMTDKRKKQLQQSSSHQQQQQHTTSHDESPNLHSVGVKFLSPFSYMVFILSVLLHFISVLIGYGLAGSESYSLLFRINESFQHYIILVVIILLTCIIIFGSKSLQHIITICTFGKGSLLVIIVFITGIVSNHISNEISNDWMYIGKSFLISTVALGGTTSTISVVFPLIVYSKREIRKCYIVAGSALFTVYLLNIVWCYFLLNIIPQLPNPDNPSMPSLQQAADNGQIATAPLMKIINLYYPQFNWISLLVNIFISVSITISFITIGNGFKHTLDGFSQSWRSSSLSNSYHDEDDELDDEDDIDLVNGGHGGDDFFGDQLNEDGDVSISPPIRNNQITYKIKGFKQKMIYKFIHQYRRSKIWVYNQVSKVNSFINRKEQGGSSQSSWESLSNVVVRIPIREYFFYIFFFGLILLIAMMNPRGFIKVLENGTSMGLNYQCGIATPLMLIKSRSQNFAHYSIPSQLPNYIYSFRYIVLSYFAFAVLYDIYVILF